MFFLSLLVVLQHLQTQAQAILHQAAVARSILKAIEGQTYICKDLEALKDLLADLREVHAKFDLSLPKDGQGLVVPDCNISSLLCSRQKNYQNTYCCTPCSYVSQASPAVWNQVSAIAQMWPYRMPVKLALSCWC